MKTLQDLKQYENTERTKVIIRSAINLDGAQFEFAPRCTVIFRGGCFYNGTLVGNQTTLKTTKENVFRNCNIKGSWETESSYSSMFNEDIDAVSLFKNMACLSPILKLYANRNYRIDEKGQELIVSEISSAGNEKPVIEFHTTNPNMVGLLIDSNNIVLKNLIIIDDYNRSNDMIWGINDITNGSTIGVQSKRGRVQTMLIDNCEFRGGTPSSYVASSQVLNCIVKNCSFSGYLADHAVYCSTRIESFMVRDCIVADIINTTGIFKVRASKELKSFSLESIKAHNLNGYLAVVSLLESNSSVLLFDKISVTKDLDNKSVFLGFCVTDETKSLEGSGRYNAQRLVVRNCHFGYGYNGAPFIYQGSGKRACIKAINYDNTHTVDSSFNGGFSDLLTITNCQFDNCFGEKGISFSSRIVSIEKTFLSCMGNNEGGYIFIINNTNNNTESVIFKDVIIDAHTRYLFNIGRSENLSIQLEGCRINSLKRSVFYVRGSNKLKYRLSGLDIKDHNVYKVVEMRN